MVTNALNTLSMIACLLKKNREAFEKERFMLNGDTSRIFHAFSIDAEY